jgi:hypothetical protein
MAIFLQNRYRWCTVLWYLLVCHSVCYAKNGADSLPGKRSSIRILPVPDFGYAPETSTYIGAVSLFTIDFYKDSSTRVSNAKFEVNYTWKRQAIIEAGWNYFFNKEKWYTQGTLHYSKYPDLYYGIGGQTPDSAVVHYQSKRIIADVNFLRRIGKGFFIGPKIVYNNYYSLQYDSAEVFYPELIAGNVFKGGYTVLKDTRNNLLNAAKGIYFEWSNVFSFSKQQYSKYYLDIRKYYTPVKNLTAAVRLYNEFTAGTPLFYDYALIGGDKLVRGYYYGRFRDKNISTLQAEVRAMLIWRLGLAAFGGITRLYPAFNEFNFSNIKPNYGAGLRFLIDRKNNINLRFDYALGANGQDGFYVAFGESF